MHDILKKILDKIDLLANRYERTKDQSDMTEYILFRSLALDWIIHMSFEKILDFDNAWNSELYIDYVTHKIGCFKPHNEGCNCITCNYDQMQKYIDWRNAL